MKIWRNIEERTGRARSRRRSRDCSSCGSARWGIWIISYYVGRGSSGGIGLRVWFDVGPIHWRYLRRARDRIADPRHVA